MDYSPPGSSVLGILQARTLEWVATSFSRGSFPPRDRTCISYLAAGFFTVWATREAQWNHKGPYRGKWERGWQVKLWNSLACQCSCLSLEGGGGRHYHQNVRETYLHLSVFYKWLCVLAWSLSCIGEGNGNPLQCSCLENSRDRGAWWAAVCGVT